MSRDRQKITSYAGKREPLKPVLLYIYVVFKEKVIWNLKVYKLSLYILNSIVLLFFSHIFKNKWCIIEKPESKPFCSMGRPWMCFQSIRINLVLLSCDFCVKNMFCCFRQVWLLFGISKHACWHSDTHALQRYWRYPTDLVTRQNAKTYI